MILRNALHRDPSSIVVDFFIKRLARSASKKVHQPGIEPGPIPWKGTILTIRPLVRNQSAPAGNRTRVTSMATRYYTTKPPALISESAEQEMSPVVHAHLGVGADL